MKQPSLTIYSSIPRYLHLRKEIKVLDYSELPIYKWAKDKIEKMSHSNPSYAEEMFLIECRNFRHTLFRQVFFKIGEKCYFLDFFIANKNIAIEIDGAYHRSEEQAERDRQRDADFRSIGIRTIRFTTWQMRDPYFRSKYYVPALNCVGKPINIYETKQVQQLKTVIEKLKSMPKGGCLEIRTKNTALFRSIDGKDAPNPKSRNYAILAEFYDVKRERVIVVTRRFVGKTDNMKKYERKWINKLAAQADAASPTEVLVV